MAASSHSTKQLPWKEVTYTTGSPSRPDEADCLICMKSIQDQATITHEVCKHSFHIDCFEMWISDKAYPKCPYCIQALTSTPRPEPTAAQTNDRTPGALWKTVKFHLWERDVLNRRYVNCHYELVNSHRWRVDDNPNHFNANWVRKVVWNRLNYEDYTGLPRRVMLQRIATALRQSSADMTKDKALALAEPRLELVENTYGKTAFPERWTLDLVLARIRNGEL